MTSALPPFELTPALEQALLRKYDAEAAKAAAEAEKETQYAIAQKVQTDALVRAEAEELVGDRPLRHYTFGDPVGPISVGRCLRELALWHRLTPECEMDIILNSPGGDVVEGLRMIDQIRAYSLRCDGGHRVKMTVEGMAASMASVILQSADERVMGRESWLLVHDGSAYTGGSLGTIKDTVKWYDRLTERIDKLFVERSNGKTTMEQMEQFRRKEWWIDSDEALERGFVDKVE